MSKRTPPKQFIQAVQSLPVSELTLDEIADVTGRQRSTVRWYLTLLRRDDGSTPYARSLKGISLWRYQEQRAAAKKAAREDPRIKLSQATWDVYAASLTAEEMNRWFRRGT